ncbi:unnamed protein product [Prorocentrum cordatum]|uniref:Uncharacterized protein n=1 Tax=Prorocentrum cordatum TaxID=2364126 RepID=A0ABN9UGG6_9DINO|nr:unnamed protein product [Polarella glacialis]
MANGSMRGLAFATGAGVEDAAKERRQPLGAGPGSEATREPVRISPALASKIREVQRAAAAQAFEFLVHGRVSLVGLALLQVIRAFCWLKGNIPGATVLGMHFLTTISDVAVCFFAVPLFFYGTSGQCVQLGCLGPMLTLVFAMTLVDLSALVAYLVVATPRPLSPDSHSFVDVLEACIGIWEFVLVASVALQVSLCLSTWRVYRGLRKVGLYPPDSDPTKVGASRDVSVLEVVCEAEDVELLSNWEPPCMAHDPAHDSIELASDGRARDNSGPVT